MDKLQPVNTWEILEKKEKKPEQNQNKTNKK